MNSEQLKNELKSRIASPGIGYWERIDASLQAIANDSDTVEAALPSVPPVPEPPVVLPLPTTSDEGRWPRSRILAIAATLTVILGLGFAAIAANRGNDGDRFNIAAGNSVSSTTADQTESDNPAFPTDLGDNATSADGAEGQTTDTVSPTTASCETVDPSADGGSVVFFANCGSVAGPPFPIYRLDGATNIQSALDAMVDGLTTQEQADGPSSPFDPADDISATFAVDSSGLATVEFMVPSGERWLPGSLTSNQLRSILDPVVATVFAFSDATMIDSQGLCWGEQDCDRPITRTEFEQTNFVNWGSITSSQCDLGAHWTDPDRCTVDGQRNSDRHTPAVVVNVAEDDTLSVRAGPGADNFELTQLGPGVAVNATEVVEVADDGGSWRLIVPTDDQAGWVNESFLEIGRSDFSAIADDFIRFAQSHSAEDLAKLPLADTVQLGLGPELMVTVGKDELTDPETWIIQRDLFRAYEGPFNIIGPLEDDEPRDIIFGDHPHCAGAPMPDPVGFEDHSQISIQPGASSFDSCLVWYTVDLFLNDQAQIEAITLDVWEP